MRHLVLRLFICLCIAPFLLWGGDVVFKVGNSHVAGYMFDKDQIIAKYRIPCSDSDLERKVEGWLSTLSDVNQSIIGSVNTRVAPFVESALIKKKIPIVFFDRTRLSVFFQGGPISREMGADLIANVYGFRAIHPDQDGIIIDFGTATTYMALARGSNIQGIAINAGMQGSLDMLHLKTTLLPALTVSAPQSALGTTTEECMFSGVFFSQIGAAKEFVLQMKKAAGFDDVVVIVTGGFINEEDDGSGYYPDNDISLHLRRELKALQFELSPDLTAMGLYKILKELSSKKKI